MRKLIKKNPAFQNIIIEVFDKISFDPKHLGLNSHKVVTSKFGICFSSRVSGDIRILWKYSQIGVMEIIDLIDIGGHDCSGAVYN